MSNRFVGGDFPESQSRLMNGVTDLAVCQLLAHGGGGALGLEVVKGSVVAAVVLLALGLLIAALLLFVDLGISTFIRIEGQRIPGI